MLSVKTLAKCVLASVLAVGGVAGAQPADPYAHPAPPPAIAGPRQQGRVAAPLRAAIMARFDRNHDGQLDPRERRQAVRALRRLARQLQQANRAQLRGALRRRAIVDRYDLNGDGVVDPSEMPPAAANRLRWRDRNRDGWLDDAELGR
jgi:hypothetical protein